MQVVPRAISSWWLVAIFALGVATASSGLRAQTAPPAAVKESILAATGYDEAAIEISTAPIQIIVTVLNSPLIGSLVTHAEREAEAAQIVRAIETAWAGSAELAAIQAVHIDYVSRQLGSDHTDAVDGIDFRRNVDGRLELHKT